MTALANVGAKVMATAKKALFVFCIILAAVIVLLGIFVWWRSTGVFSTSRFEQKEWLSSEPAGNENSYSCYRGGMARDIKNRLLIPGMSKEDVMSLLGKPDNSANPQELEYNLGMCSGFKMDYDGLVIRFTSNGRLVNAYIAQH